MAIASLKRSSLRAFNRYNNFLAGNSTAGDYELISTLLPSGAESTLSFSVSSLASVYKHLQIRATIRTSSATTESDAYAIRFNSDSGTNYSWHFMGYTGGAGTLNSASATGVTYAWGMPIPGANFTANAFGAYITDFPDIFSSTKNKTLKTLCAYGGSVPRVYQVSAAWFSTSAVTSITITTNTGANFASGSRFSLYGLRA